MGITRIILVFLFVVSGIFCTAQQSIDTVFFEGKPYIKHIVSSNNKISYIASLYNVKVRDILDHNEVGSQLYYKQVLYIPVNIEKKKFSFFKKKKNPKKPDNKIKEDTIRVAILLPFLIPDNDTLTASFKDKNEAKSVIYSKSEMALSFFQGLELGLDSLIRSDMKVFVQVYDTRNDTLRVHQIAQSEVLNESDLIIGPLFEKNLQILCKYYGKDSSKKIISPLSKSTNPVKRNPSIYQINSPFQIQVENIKDFILNKYKNRRVCIFYDTLDHSRALYLKEIFKREKKFVYLDEIRYTHVDSIRLIVREDQCVIIPSYDNAFTSRILSSLGSIDSTFVVFGLNNWKIFSNLDVENLMELNTHICDPFYFDAKNNFEQRFMYLFEEKYKASSNRFSYLGFQIILHFCLKKDIFSFKPLKPRSGQINTRAPILIYKDFELSPPN